MSCLSPNQWQFGIIPSSLQIAVIVCTSRLHRAFSSRKEHSLTSNTFVQSGWVDGRRMVEYVCTVHLYGSATCTHVWLCHQGGNSFNMCTLHFRHMCAWTYLTPLGWTPLYSEKKNWVSWLFTIERFHCIAKCSHVQCKHVAQLWNFYTHKKIHFPQWHFFFYIPFMQPGNLSFRALSKTAGDTQFPRTPFTPSIGVGTVSCLFVVEMTVLLSTLATSAGSVLANQLHTQT